jgi:cellobiose epimerase
MKTNLQTSIVAILLFGLLINCNSENNNNQQSAIKSKAAFHKIIETSLFEELINHWYPANIDSVNGGYITDFNHDWKVADGPQVKALVHQARHIWSTSFIYENYPDKKEFLGYAAHGFQFLKEHLWDKESGGFYGLTLKDGTPEPNNIDKKELYGQAFAIYGLSLYYKVSNDSGALNLVKKAFMWLENNAHDKKYGGYFQHLHRNGKPVLPDENEQLPTAGLKDFNSSIHALEALTTLYQVWPDSLVRKRLEESFYIIRDTMVHPDGYLKLYFNADWTPVDYQEFEQSKIRNPYFKDHFSYGHDVETAFLLLETAEALGLAENEKTLQITKRLVDHSLELGWDNEKGGFFDGGILADGKSKITDDKKSWWTEAEGLNALLIMHNLYPDDQHNYYSKFAEMWNYINTYLIDKEHGGWYNYGLDTSPKSKKQPKSHIWKGSYHNARSLVNCLKMLKVAE